MAGMGPDEFADGVKAMAEHDHGQTLAEFLTARFDEAGGLAALVSTDFDDEWDGPADDDDEVYVGVHMLANQVAADCETKRRIVALHDRSHECPAVDGVWDSIDMDDPCPTVLALAQPYVDHPGFREEWRL